MANNDRYRTVNGDDSEVMKRGLMDKVRCARRPMRTRTKSLGTGLRVSTHTFTSLLSTPLFCFASVYDALSRKVLLQAGYILEPDCNTRGNLVSSATESTKITLIICSCPLEIGSRPCPPMLLCQVFGKFIDDCENHQPMVSGNVWLIKDGSFRRFYKIQISPYPSQQFIGVKKRDRIQGC
jgi:hypothetical protein